MSVSKVHLLIVFGVFLPVLFLVSGMGPWAVGCMIGEGLGLISFIWIGHTVRRLLAQKNSNPARHLIMNSLGRYVMMGAAILFSLQWPGGNVWGLVLGYSVVQLPAAVLKGLAPTNS